MKNLRKEIRLIGFDDSPFNKFKDKKVLVVGVFYRGGNFLDGVISFNVKKDGNDASDQLIKAVKKSKFRANTKALLFKGIAFAGFNVIDIKRIHKKTGIPCIVVMRKYPDYKRIKKALMNVGGWKKKLKQIELAGIPKKASGLYVQSAGLSINEIRNILKISCIHSSIPEPIRVAHIISSGIVKGESRGSA